MRSAGTVLSINLAVPERNAAKRSGGLTGINKQPVDHPVAVAAPPGRGSGVAGDQIFDTRHHGGDDQAVYAYAREDLDWWQEALGRPLPPGMFGENLTTAGVDVNGAVIGERWRIGADLVLEATYGREPCATFQARMREPQWVKRFAAANRTGAYLRVVTPGRIRSGDPIVVLDRPAHGVTIRDAFQATYHEPEFARDLLSRPGLTPSLQARLERHAS
jgi:MOSC domain-containing protein YiiM